MKKTKTATKKRRTKRPTKKELEKKKALNRLLIAVVTVLLCGIAMVRLGKFGVTLYNIVRLEVGSLAYPVMIAVVIYILGYKKLHKIEGLVFGFLITLIGFLISWHSLLFMSKTFSGKPVLATTNQLLMSDLLQLRVSNFVGGGYLGVLFYKPVAFLFSEIGSLFIGFLLILLGLFLISSWDVYDIIEFSKKGTAYFAGKIEQKRQENFLKREALKELEEQEKAKATTHMIVDKESGEILDHVTYPQEEIVDQSEPEIFTYDYTDQDYPYEEEVQDYEGEEGEIEEQDEPITVDFSVKEALLYKLPSIDLFAPSKTKSQNKEKSLVRRNISLLEETFKSFGIDVKVERAEIGPSVTKYEVKPAVGIRVNRISNLADDLALALAAKDVRIEAPIPGKSLVGIEIPNSEVATVSFRELWEQSQTDATHLLEVPLGKAVNGSVKSFDLARMPHLLVAGSTGSGKSVAVNGIISSILMKARPDQVKFMMIDPKMVELSVYNDIPHLLIPVVTNPRKASKALQKVVDEMENRYELFSKTGVRNIEGFNEKVADYNTQSDQKQIPLPLIVVIVDELADLMMVASKEVEDAIIRLGQKARAAGIHMILATQRPSVDVISGLIKANVPSRIAFAVSSGTDSRTILDENGAEKLLGRGDMLFKPITENHPIRLQGSFISDDDVERIVNFIKEQSEADYDESFDPGEVSEIDENGRQTGANEGDPLFNEAKQLVLETQKASASMLQRRLSVGFNRATRLMEELEEAGVIGPAEGTKPRKVLQTPQG